ncbi:MAG: inositol monophosphatase [Parcubacteria group bacterium]|nr:inositol monophosphatase [Parcubacteria group bacterium]
MTDVCEEIQKRVYARIDEILILRNERTIKDDNSFVTEGDLLCQDIITSYIGSLPETFEVVSEEKALEGFSYDGTKNYVVLDPVDGTENFTSGLKEWGVSVSVYRRGKHAESMILLPELDLCLVTGSAISKRASRIHGLSSSLSSAHLQGMKDGLEYRITGCCVYNLYNVITGSFASFENPKGARVWDVLAGFNLALEHGLAVTVNGIRYTGEFLDPTKRYCFKIQHA